MVITEYLYRFLDSDTLSKNCKDVIEAREFDQMLRGINERFRGILIQPGSEIPDIGNKKNLKKRKYKSQLI